MIDSHGPYFLYELFNPLACMAMMMASVRIFLAYLLLVPTVIIYPLIVKMRIIIKYTDSILIDVLK